MPSVRDIAKSFTMNAAQTLCKDASFIPEEKLDWSPMDYGKSVNAILSECAESNMLITALVKGEDPGKVSEGLDFQALKGCVIESAEQLCSAIDSLSDSDLEGDMQMPWGPVMSAAEAIMLASTHMNYHDGQINYIQLLLGDTRFHWAEE